MSENKNPNQNRKQKRVRKKAQNGISPHQEERERLTTTFRFKGSLLGVDPGPTQSAVIVFENGSVGYSGIEDNINVLDTIKEFASSGSPTRNGKYNRTMVIERIQGMGVPLGNSTIETIEWIGRFCQAWDDATWQRDNEAVGYKRNMIRATLCGTTRSKDANIRARLIDMFGGKPVAIGKMHDRGPLHFISKDMWQALAVVVTHMIITARGEREFKVDEL